MNRTVKEQLLDVSRKVPVISLGILGSFGLQEIASIVASFAAAFSGLAGGLYALVSAIKLLVAWRDERKNKEKK